MRFLHFFLITLAFSWMAPAPAKAQFLPAASQEKTAEEKPAWPEDPLGRRTPRGAVTGYIDAMAKEDYTKAAEYLDLSYLPQKQRTQQGPELAKRLQTALDRSGSIEANALLSDSPDGHANDNQADTRDKVGSFKAGEETIAVFVERADGADGGPLWLFSAESLEKLPVEADLLPALNVDAVLPPVLMETKWAGVPAGHWLAMVVLLVAAYLLGWMITATIGAIARRYWPKDHIQRRDDLIRAFALPIRLYLTVAFLAFSARALGVSIIARQYFNDAAILVAWVAFLILLWRLIDVAAGLGERQMARRGNLGGLSAVLFFRRSVKFILLAFGVITILDTLGFDVTTGLAALGIGGLALALGAQKTVENLVGSLTVIFDQPVRVGDYCKVGETAGTIEQIGMRSTRIRTLDRTVVTIPNGDFSAQRIENFAKRDRFWFHPTLGLRYETTPDQMRYLLVELRAMLYAHPRVDPDPARVRFLGFAADSLTIEIFAYVHAKDFAEFLEVQEDLNLRMMDIVDASGSGFAFPSQTLYFARDSKPAAEKADAAKAKVKEWTDRGDLQLPNFNPSRIEELKGTIPWPPQGSTVKPEQG